MSAKTITILWAVYIALGVIADIVLNAINPNLTLSARIWQLEGINQGQPGWSLLRFGLLAILVWLILHLVFKVARGI
jgi:hypothetical protein